MWGEIFLGWELWYAVRWETACPGRGSVGRQLAWICDWDSLVNTLVSIGQVWNSFINILVWSVLLIFPDLHELPADPGFLEKDALDNAAAPFVPSILRLFPTSQTHPACFGFWLALFIVPFTSAPLLKPNLVSLSLASWQVWILQIRPGSEEKQLFKDLEFNWKPKWNTTFHSG